MKRNLLLFFLTFIFLNYCKAQGHTQVFKVEKPDASNIYYQVVKNFSKQLGLKNIEYGVKEMEIRLWIKYEMLDFNEVITIKKESNQWTAYYYPYQYGDGAPSERKIIKLKKVKVSPTLGWEHFIAVLEKNKVATLPDMQTIKGLHDGYTDGVSYIVEIASPSSYRFYKYHLPDEFADKYWQAKNMTTIIGEFEKEFELDKRRKNFR